MKTSIKLTAIFGFLLLTQACNTSYPAYQYDDAYYTPGNDPIQQAKKDPREDFNKTDNIQYDNNHANPYNETTDRYASTPESYYSQNRYSQSNQATSAENIEPENYSYTSPDQSTQVEEYYDPEYAQTVININSPVRSIDTYDPYQRDRILYTQDPYFYGPSLYAGNNFWNPYSPSIGLGVGWNSWSGWNVGVGVGIGVRFGFGGGWGPGYYDPFNPWARWNAWNPYSYCGFGYSPYVNNYWNGYHHGFYDGVNSNGYYTGANTSHSSNGYRRVNTPRGNSGSAVQGSGATRPSRPVRNTTSNARLRTPTNASRTSSSSRELRPNGASARPTSGNTSRSNSPNVRPVSNTPSRQSSTPARYRVNRTPESYSRPNQTIRPSSGNPSNARPRTNSAVARPNTSRPSSARPAQAQPSARPSYARPTRNNSYNAQPQTRPSARPSSRPQQSARPNRSYNNSRPSMNNSRPSYNPSPSRSGGGGMRSAPSSRPSRR